MTVKKPWLLTSIYAIAFVSLGITEVIGATLPSLADLFGATSSPGLSYALVCRGIGYFVGTMIMGKFLDRWPSQAHRLWGVSSLVFGGSAIAIPYSETLLGFSGVLFVFATAAGGILLAGNVLVIRVWEGTKYTASGINLIHVGNSVGSCIMPLIAENIGIDDEGVVIVYRVLGIAAAVAGLLPLFFTAPEKQNYTPLEFAMTPRSAGRVKFWSLITLFFFYFFYQGALTDAGDWITTYIVDRSQGTVSDGALATSAFWGAILFVRILCVPLAIYVNYDLLILVEFILAIAGCCIAVTYGIEEYEWTVIAYVLIGLGIAAMFPAGLILARSRMVLNAMWISVIISGGIVGAILLPTITGLLLDNNIFFLPWSEFLCVGLMGLFYLIVYLMPKVRTIEVEANVVLAKSVYNFQSTLPTAPQYENSDYQDIAVGDVPRVNYVKKDDNLHV